MLYLFRFLLRPLRSPLPWLFLQLISVFLTLQAGRLLEPRMVADTASYRTLAQAQTLKRVLGSYRTYGYPLFLRALGYGSDGEIESSPARSAYRVFRKVPTVQAVVFLASILLFWWAVRVYSGSPWLAFAFAVPLPFAGIWELVRRVQPDFLAAALALVTVSLFILLTSKPRALTWLGLTVALFLTYQVRPGYLFLIALLPLIGPVLRWIASDAPWTRLWRFEIGLLGAMVLPLLLFCTMRWFVVRDFGLVPFGGHSSIGVAASLLDPGLVRGLERNKKLAKRILLKRQVLDMKPILLGGDTELWRAEHNTNVWDIAVPAAHATVKKARNNRRKHTAPQLRTDDIESNQRLAELSVAVFRRRPLNYLQWVRDGLLLTLNRTLADNWIRWPGILLVLSVPFALLARAGSGLLSFESRDLERRRRLLALTALGFGFFFSHALIVVLVDVPYDRFVVAMTLLLPSVFCGVLFELWRSVRLDAKGASDGG